MEINRRIIEELDKKSLRQTQLCEYIKVANSTLNNWLKLNRSIPAEYIFPISEFLEIDPIYLLTGKGASLTKDEKELLHIYKNLDERGKTMVRAKAFEESDRMLGKNFKEEYGKEIIG
ncbi:MAG: hypothetical protein BWY15_00461 [Firmicutes bacterium ADurb.Bin193]|nr:MAG: hypothetical protein BWY15_00461 [Firmicutes bacterium ADurb.Bin193]